MKVISPSFLSHEHPSIFTFAGNNPNLNRHTSEDLDDLIEWDFLAKSIYSASHANPKRKMESSFREGLDDVIREIMENINTYSRQRGRVIEYRELLYGYSRVNSMHGHDLILDLLLVYKKYRGKKMTVPVRKHLYIQRSFTETRIRDVTSRPDTINRDYGNFHHQQHLENCFHICKFLHFQFKVT